jgi:hypothetical protein
MPGTCLACRHPQKNEIDRLILAKTPFRRIAAAYGLTKSSLHRHRAHHMERAFRKFAQRMEAADGYNADSMIERLQTISAMTLSILGKAVQSNDLGAAVGAIKQAREHLSFEAELIGELNGVHNEVKLNVVYGHGVHPQLLDGRECPTCHRAVNIEQIENQYNHAIRRALGVLPDDGEPDRPGQNGTPTEEVPAGVEENVGDREQETQVLQAQIVQRKVTTPAVPPRPMLPAHEPEAALRVIRNPSAFDWNKL